MKLLIRIDAAVAAVIKVIISAALFAIMALLFVGVIARYFFNSPIIWVDESATYLLVCMTFLGGYIALRSDRLVRVTFVLSLLPKRAEKAVNVIAQLVICVFLIVLGYFSYKMLSTPVALSQKTVALRLPMIIFYVQIPIMVVLMLLRMVINIYHEFHPETEEISGEEEGK